MHFLSSSSKYGHSTLVQLCTLNTPTLCNLASSRITVGKINIWIFEKSKKNEEACIAVAKFNSSSSF